MSDSLNPEEHPFGQTKYRNFDPEQVNTPEDTVNVLEWVADENEKKGKYREADVFRDAASMIRVSLVENDE